MYRSSPLRSTLNTGYIRFGYVSVSSMYRSTRCDKKCKKKSPKAKTRPGKKGTKAREGCIWGSANVPVCGYIYLHIYVYILFICLNFHLDTSEISKKSQWRFHPSRGMGCAIYSSVSAGSKWLGRASRVSMWTSGSMARRVLPVAALLALWRRSMDLDGSTLGCPKELSKLPAGSAPGVSLSKLTERSSQKHFVGGQYEKTKSKTAQNLQSGQWLDRLESI